MSTRPRPKATNAAFVQLAVSCFEPLLTMSKGLPPPDEFESPPSGVGSGATALDVGAEASIVGSGD